jgi:hypothetical protein
MTMRYPGLAQMTKRLAKAVNKEPECLRRVALDNIKNLVEGIPPEDMLSIFEGGD